MRFDFHKSQKPAAAIPADQFQCQCITGGFNVARCGDYTAGGGCKKGASRALLSIRCRLPPNRQTSRIFPESMRVLYSDRKTRRQQALLLQNNYCHQSPIIACQICCNGGGISLRLSFAAKSVAANAIEGYCRHTIVLLCAVREKSRQSPYHRYARRQSSQTALIRRASRCWQYQRCQQNAAGFGLQCQSPVISRFDGLCVVAADAYRYIRQAARDN